MNAWSCDRCGKVSRDGNVDDPPEDWRHFDAPVRGAEGHRSTQKVVICDECDDALYAWWHQGGTR